jgi:hypothetical protein
MGTNWRETNPYIDYSEDDFIYLGKQSVATRRLNQAVSNGTIKKGHKCVICGKTKGIVGHHYKGYDYPFDVWWICRRCNSILSNKSPESNLHNAKLIVFSKIFFQPERIHRKWGKQFAECEVCGVWDRRNNMIIIEENGGYMDLCTCCGEKVLQRNTEKGD